MSNRVNAMPVSSASVSQTMSLFENFSTIINWLIIIKIMTLVVNQKSFVIQKVDTFGDFLAESFKTIHSEAGPARPGCHFVAAGHHNGPSSSLKLELGRPVTR